VARAALRSVICVAGGATEALILLSRRVFVIHAMISLRAEKSIRDIALKWPGGRLQTATGVTPVTREAPGSHDRPALEAISQCRLLRPAMPDK
jgi:hypothetical protein